MKWRGVLGGSKKVDKKMKIKEKKKRSWLLQRIRKTIDQRQNTPDAHTYTHFTSTVTTQYIAKGHIHTAAASGRIESVMIKKGRFKNILNSVTRNFIELFHLPTLMHYFLYSLTICLLHYYPRHVSSINMHIFRRKKCIHTASGIFALCKRLHSTLVESGLNFSS